MIASNAPVQRGGRIDSFAQFFPPSHPRVSLLATRPPSSSSLLGRGIFAKRALTPGTAILSLPAHAAVLDTANLQRRCSACFLEDADFAAGGEERDKGKQVRRCTRCFVVSYCSAVRPSTLLRDSPSLTKRSGAGVSEARLALAQARVRGAQPVPCQGGPARAPEPKGKGLGRRRQPGGAREDPVVARQGAGEVDVAQGEGECDLGKSLSSRSRCGTDETAQWENILDLESRGFLWRWYRGARLTGRAADYQHCGGPAKEKLMQLALALSRFVGASLIKDLLGSAQELLDFCSKVGSLPVLTGTI